MAWQDRDDESLRSTGRIDAGRVLSIILSLVVLPDIAFASIELTPRLGVYVNASEIARVPVTFGVAVQPSGRHTTTVFLAPQLDVDLSGAEASFAPTARLGLLVRNRKDEWKSSFVSWVRLYGIVGYRLPGGAGDGPGGIRGGVGLDSGVGLLLTLAGFKHGVPIPNAIEVIWEDTDGQEASAVLYLGIAI